MNLDNRLANEIRNQLSFLFSLKEGMKELDDRIRITSLHLARRELMDRHKNIDDWDILDRPDESIVKGLSEGRTVVLGKVRTMSLHGKSGLGGRQHDAMKRNIQRIEDESCDFKYMFLLDPWTVNVVTDTFKPGDVTVLPLLKEDMAQVLRTESPKSKGAQGPRAIEPMTQMVEEVITKEDFPEDRTIVSPISRTSLRQGFLYIPKDKGHLLEEGDIQLWIRKDASLTSKCMISKTGGVRIGGGLTKWFRSMGLSAEDELVMGSKEDGSLLVLMVRRSTPFRGNTPTVETVKWE